MISRCLRLPLTVIFLLSMGEWAQSGVKLKPETVQGYDRYVQDLETSFQKRLSGEMPFLWSDQKPEHRAALKRGRILIDELKDLPEVPGARIHVWLGAVFIPGAVSADVLSVLMDFDRHREWYPEVLDSRLLSRDEYSLRGYQRLRMKKILTVIFNTEHEVVYTKVSPKRWRGVSRSTRIAEVKDAGMPKEREMPVGDDRGFMWRLNAYWHLEEREGGVAAECWAVTLSRKIPFGLRWMLKPLVTSVPRQALRNTLRGTRQAVLDGRRGGARNAQRRVDWAYIRREGRSHEATTVTAANIGPWAVGSKGALRRRSLAARSIGSA
ncbi:MAG: hypothetical protein OXH11_21055 [Candidatus Aminicenantes bacterium]|nr:hypothetical protein [Candidatus Aminicenantes bacterium]